ncbi:Inosine-5'-monophosphate dehydrogenase [Rickettsiales bacterium Ac37b]|nr:Inosine-5'-monophosphate dehydrogenase [Rickettsiales bacterium Ac37b]
MKFEKAFTFDDVLLKPAFSSTLPSDVDLSTFLTSKIKLSIPLMSASMDTVTGSSMAIAMAQNGGIGCIHKNLTIEQQASKIRKVKKFESGMVINPITINPEAKLYEALALMKKHNISGIPVVEVKGNVLVGILTNRDVRFADNHNQVISELMTQDNLITVRKGVSEEEAKRLLHQHRIEKLIVVDEHNSCIGLITVKDIEKAQAFPYASKDSQGRLRVSGAVGIDEEGFERAKALIDAEVDVIVVDTAHGHSEKVLKAISRIKAYDSNIQIIGGNIATAEGAKALIDVGCDAVKVGIGPGSICTTRIVAGVGVPQLSAILDVSEVCKQAGVKLIADGGIKYSGDIAKAIAAGADIVMVGSLFAGTEESPGEIILYHGRSYKSYRGMGSLAAMAAGSADRYFQRKSTKGLKLVPEGVEGMVPFKGAVANVIYQLMGGLRASMGYTGNSSIDLMQKNCKFVCITGAGLKESHAHDVVITREAPNYAVHHGDE